jgi:UDP-N-acetylglucosamine transferase subunit ALG13
VSETVSRPALVVAMLGTDHHPFSRLVDWIDDVALQVGRDVRFVVQHGASRAPLIAEGRDFLPHDEIEELLAEADAVVCHGGPGTIMDARKAGHVPVCVPRNPDLGEHVDRHQQRFADLVHRAGVVTHVRTRAEFAQAVQEAIGSRAQRERLPSGTVAVEPTSEHLESAFRRLALQLDDLCGARPTRRSSVGQVLLSRVVR